MSCTVRIMRFTRITRVIPSIMRITSVIWWIMRVTRVIPSIMRITSVTDPGLRGLRGLHGRNPRNPRSRDGGHVGKVRLTGIIVQGLYFGFTLD